VGGGYGWVECNRISVTLVPGPSSLHAPTANAIHTEQTSARAVSPLRRDSAEKRAGLLRGVTVGAVHFTLPKDYILDLFIDTVSIEIYEKKTKSMENKLACTLQNPTVGVLVAEGVLGRQTGLWSTETKVWGIVPKAVWHWAGDSSVANDPFRAPGSTPPSTRTPSTCW
jgi:hypothetical protein